MNKIFRVVWNQATQSWVAVSELTKAHKKQSSSNSLKAVVGTAAVLLSINTAQAAVAIGETTANNTFNQSPAQATGTDAVAIGNGSNANQTRAIAIGKGATISSGQDTIAIGTETKAQGHTSIVIGKNAKTTQGAEGTVVIGRDAFSEGSGKVERANTVVGRGAYTAFGQNGEYRLNAATALGLQAGAGVIVDPANNRKLVNNNTNADNNAEVLVKAGYGLDANAPADTKAALQGGNVNNNLTFYRKNHINEATAIGVEARAIGDQSIAIGGQVVAGDGVVALGGNDTDQLRNNKYQVVTDDAVNKTKVETIDDYNLAYTESTNTVEGQYKKLVGRGMPTAYKSTYGQSGSVVIGMEAHSTTALGTAIGTNSVVRMGAFGATAIGAGSTVQPNAEAAVAIGMGSVANGAYALAGGTASWADYGDIALGYQAKATGKDGAIAMGRATNAQGDSSIMIGGANIASAAAQNTSYEKANGQTIDKTVTEKINGQNVTRKYSFAGTTPATGTVAEAYKELTGITMDTAALDFAKNKNGHASTSLGVHALSKGDLGTAIGAGSRSDAIGSVALGTGAHATRQNAVAIGTGSTTDLVGTRQLSVNYDSDGNIVSDNSDKIAYTFKWAGGINTSEGDVVSFGSSGAERQLKNVAAGRVAEDSTDAINGSQLNSITKKIAVGFNTSGNVVDGSSGEFTSKQKNANVDSTKKDYETAIRSLDKIQLQVGNNLKLDRNETESEIDDPDSPDKNNPLKKKIKKADFAYSLNPILTNLTSAEFKGTDANAPTTMLTNAGVTITPEASTRKKPVSLTENGLDNGGNPITNVAGNLEGAKANTTAPTNEAAKPDNADTIKNNAATVGDVLNAGWNLQEKGAAKDFVTAYDTVNFIDGNGTTVSVENTDNKTSTIKYSANLGDGLEKTNDNKIKVKAADKSLEVTNEGVKVKAADNTLTTDANGLKVNTGNITTAAVPTVTAGDENKIATVGNVADAIKAAAWNATSAATTSGENTGMKVQPVKAGDTVTFEADKNIKIAQTDGKFTFSTKDNVEFTTVKVGDTTNGKKPVELKNGDVINANNNPEQPATALNVSSDGKPTQITGVGSVLNTDAVPTIPAGTATTGNDQPKLVNLGTGHNQTALGNNVLNAAATVRDLANMGWVVSSDKATDGAGEYKDVVKNANEVKFVGKNAAKVSGKTDPTTGIRTITVDVEVPSVETAKITQNTDGSVTGPAGETLTKELKDAKDALAKLPKDADAATVKEAQDKVDAAQKAIDNSPNSNKVATAQNVADMINNSGFTLKTSATADGKKDAASTGDEVINPGKAVEMVAGKNLTVKQEANGKVTYSTKDEVEFNTVKVGGDANTYVDDKGNPVTKKEDGSFEDAEGNKVAKDKVSPVAPVTLKTEKASPANNNAEGNHPTTALNVSSDGKPTQITGVGSTLNVKPVGTNPNGTPTADADKPNLVDLVGTKDAPVNKNAAATVGDLQNMGWVVSTKDGNGYTDVVKNANQVDFKGDGLATVTGETKDGIRTITVNVDAQKTVEAAQNPVVYTDSEGNKVTKLGDNFYPVEEAKDAVKIGDNYYPAGTVLKDGKPVDSEGNEATALVPTDKKTVKASMNNGDNEAAPTVLSNVGSNLPTVDDVKKKAFNPNDSENPLANKSNKAAPITALEAAELLDPTSDKFAGNMRRQYQTC
ncbi:ESPR-type extended signal peptide-containing protein [Haemophilus paraphrohaemolyticus]|uniref:ESPR-type extended signal peptide-containing protein n=2 Tax=Haemophilus paraphrohaemolyticus TaxID=736 RepID=UPI00352ECF61